MGRGEEASLIPIFPNMSHPIISNLHRILLLNFSIRRLRQAPGGFAGKIEFSETTTDVMSCEICLESAPGGG